MNKNQKAIQCDQCKLWSHASCNGITKSEYELLVHEDDDVPWFCLPCQILNWADVFPFGRSSKSELLQLNGIDLPSQLATLPAYEILSRLDNLPRLNDFGLDENLMHLIDSKYHKVSDLNWDKLKDPCEDVNAKFTFFHDQLSKCVRRHVPLTKVSQKALSFRDKPWITLKIQRMIAKRDKYLNKFHKTHNLDTEYLYKKFRNKVVFEIRKSRNDYYNNYFSTHKHNMKKLWSGIRSIINVSSKSGYCISQLIQDGKEIDDPTKMANIFNKFFVNVSQKVTSGIPRTRKCPLDYLKRRNDKSLFLSNATPEETEALINSLQEGKAVGPNSVPIKLLKMISRPISLPLCLIINESFTSGIILDNLKLAKVITLYKKGSRDNPTNYRPISLLSIFSKIIEKIMYERVYRFLETISCISCTLFSLVFFKNIPLFMQ